MSHDSAVSQSYTHGDLLSAISAALARLGKTSETVSVDDLAPVDEFHIGGRLATEHCLGQLNVSERHHLLDLGCGLGGAARYVAQRYRAQVSGIDLTPEFVATGQALCAWVGLDSRITLHAGSALDMPFQDETFDGGYMMHVGMNIADKPRLFAEVYRVLRPGARFLVYDVMRMRDGALAYPVPWAPGGDTCCLATPDQYRQALAGAGFAVSAERNRRDFALAFFEALRAQAEAEGGPPPLGLHTLMGSNTAGKVGNMIANISTGIVAPVEMVARKP